MTEFSTEAFTLLGVALGVIILRSYARISAVGLKRLQADDYLMLFVAVRAPSSDICYIWRY